MDPQGTKSQTASNGWELGERPTTDATSQHSEETNTTDNWM